MLLSIRNGSVGGFQRNVEAFQNFLIVFRRGPRDAAENAEAMRRSRSILSSLGSPASALISKSRDSGDLRESGGCSRAARFEQKDSIRTRGKQPAALRNFGRLRGAVYVSTGSSTLMPHIKYFARHILYPPQTPEKLLIR